MYSYTGVALNLDFVEPLRLRVRFASGTGGGGVAARRALPPRAPHRGLKDDTAAPRRLPLPADQPYQESPARQEEHHAAH